MAFNTQGNSPVSPLCFTFAETRAVHSIFQEGEPWFSANDVCEVLDFGNPRQALDTHCDPEDVQKLDTLTPGGTQQTNFINEAGVYSLIFGSTKPEAKVFKRWVTHELLPQLRKVGFYGALDLKQSMALRNQMMGIVDRLVKAGGDAFVREALMTQLREVCLLLGHKAPDVALLGKDANQMNLGV